jgi:hypothetical protein
MKVLDLCCGALGQTKLFEGASASINQGVACGAKNPEHVPFIMLHNPIRAVSFVFRLVGYVQYARFVTAGSFACSGQVGELAIKAGNKGISTMSFITRTIVPLHPVGITLITLFNAYPRAFCSTFLG